MVPLRGKETASGNIAARGGLILTPTRSNGCFLFLFLESWATLLKRMGNSYFLKPFATISPFIGPILLAIRGGKASPLEKFFYVTMAGPLVILAVCLRYSEDTSNTLKEPDSISRQARIKESQSRFRTLLIILLAASSVLAAAAAWLLLRPN